MGFRFSGFGFRVAGLGFKVSGLGLRQMTITPDSSVP